MVGCGLGLRSPLLRFMCMGVYALLTSRGEPNSTPEACSSAPSVLILDPLNSLSPRVRVRRRVPTHLGGFDGCLEVSSPARDNKCLTASREECRPTLKNALLLVLRLCASIDAFENKNPLPKGAPESAGLARR